MKIAALEKVREITIYYKNSICHEKLLHINQVKVNILLYSKKIYMYLQILYNYYHNFFKNCILTKIFYYNKLNYLFISIKAHNKTKTFFAFQITLFVSILLNLMVKAIHTNIYFNILPTYYLKNNHKNIILMHWTITDPV